MQEKLKLFIIGFSIIIVLAGIFYIGAAYSCRNSNGELVAGLNLIKVKCNNIDVIGVCVDKGRYYIPYNLSENITIKLGG